MPQLLTIGEVSRRSGMSASALRFYEQRGLISSTRSPGNQRRYRRDVLRRIGFIQLAQDSGLSLEAIDGLLSELPEDRAATMRDWKRLADRLRPVLEARLAELDALRTDLTRTIAGAGP